MTNFEKEGLFRKGTAKGGNSTLRGGAKRGKRSIAGVQTKGYCTFSTQSKRRFNRGKKELQKGHTGWGEMGKKKGKLSNFQVTQVSFHCARPARAKHNR